MLVNNAGVTGFEGSFGGSPPAHDPENVELAAWRAVHVVSLDGTFLGYRYPIFASELFTLGVPMVTLSMNAAWGDLAVHFGCV